MSEKRHKINKFATHDQYTNPLARPLLIALQVVRTSFGENVWEVAFPHLTVTFIIHAAISYTFPHKWLIRVENCMHNKCVVLYGNLNLSFKLKDSLGTKKAMF